MGRIRVMRHPDVLNEVPYNPWRPTPKKVASPDDAAPPGTHRYINKAWKCDHCGKWHAKQDIICPKLAEK